MTTNAEVERYWNNNVANWKIAADLETGSKEFFQEVERYRFDKLHYLPKHIDYAGFTCLLYTSPSPRDLSTSRMPSSA